MGLDIGAASSKGRVASSVVLSVDVGCWLRSLCGTSEAAVSRSVDYKVLMLLCNVDLKRKKEREKSRAYNKGYITFSFLSVLLW